MEEKQHRATGKRKTSTARVFLMPGGKGQVIINHIEFQEYFKSEAHRMIITQPLVLTDNAEAFDVYVNVRGGGFTGQAGATRLGIARALLKVDPDLRPVLKKAGLLTRDPRIKERKKYGQPGARKRYQFSKR